MAHAQSLSSRGDNDDDDFAEFDPTPYSGGYNQADIYGKPKPSSNESCYPISHAAGQEHVQCEYGNERPPYLPSNPSSHGGGYMDEHRPTYVPETRPHHSGEGFESGYGRPKPSYGGEYGEGDKQHFGSGYGRPKPVPNPADESSLESGYSYGKGEESFESGYRKPKPTYGDQFEQEDSYKRPPPQGGQEGFDYGYVQPKPTYEPEDSFERRPLRPPHGRPQGEEESYGSSYGGGFGGSSYGVSVEENQESYGGDEEGEYGRKKAPGYGQEESGFGFGGRRREDEGEEEGRHGSGGRWKQGEKGGFGSAKRNDEEDEYGIGRPGYGGGGYSEETGGYGDVTSATERLSLKDSEGYGGHGRQGHHRRHDYDEE